MPADKVFHLFDRADQLEQTLCQQMNRTLRFRFVLPFFRVVSRLGDGIAWYLLILALPIISPAHGGPIALVMAFAGLTGTLGYRFLKQHLVRERPFINNPVIHCGTPPLDRYSFPSGHTLHATGFTTILLMTLPMVGLTVLPFALCVAASRVILGLHYPTDVLAGALLGVILGLSAVTLAGLA
ncbi:undecaprenyl-diphosphatase [Tamilnaduibacter salinus]|uniref:undecaprenyl-diphosphate phosphatase n=1 Tax=Tamilnaduibacter salinus TaxID=1484056 RepID=A0A2U1D0N9_9GAMM|nr:phosphatase PAP2 family protein [Tamilnaduibacter salinus]PVY78940.1 undecaprenyl-diphosphatase [Tamilnaduibacter salinus]